MNTWSQGVKPLKSMTFCISKWFWTIWRNNSGAPHLVADWAHPRILPTFCSSQLHPTRFLNDSGMCWLQSEPPNQWQVEGRTSGPQVICWLRWPQSGDWNYDGMQESTLFYHPMWQTQCHEPDLYDPFIVNFGMVDYWHHINHHLGTCNCGRIPLPILAQQPMGYWKSWIFLS